MLFNTCPNIHNTHGEREREGGGATTTTTYTLYRHIHPYPTHDVSITLVILQIVIKLYILIIVKMYCIFSNPTHSFFKGVFSSKYFIHGFIHLYVTGINAATYFYITILTNSFLTTLILFYNPFDWLTDVALIDYHERITVYFKCSCQINA